MSFRMLQEEVGWDKPRSLIVLRPLLQDGFVWVDKQAPDKETLFWFPSLMSGMASLD